MTTHNETCRAVYANLKNQLKPEEIEKLKDLSVEGGFSYSNNYFYVRDRARSVLWEGICCCKWEARCNALRTITGGRFSVIDDIVKTLTDEVLGPKRVLSEHTINHIRTGLTRLTVTELGAFDIVLQILK